VSLTLKSRRGEVGSFPKWRHGRIALCGGEFGDFTNIGIHRTVDNARRRARLNSPYRSLAGAETTLAPSVASLEALLLLYKLYLISGLRDWG
jgi:hypothetical protein